MHRENERQIPGSGIILTGGSSGIGKAFIEYNNRLRNRPFLCNLSRRFPANFLHNENNFHLSCDVGERESLTNAVRELETRWLPQLPPGPLILLNNAGFGAYGPFPAPDLATHLNLIDVNIRAVVHLTGLLLPHLRERGGWVVNIASTAAFQPTPQLATYGASKSFLLHWTLALNDDLRGSGIRALAVCPGPTKSEFFRRAGLKEGARTGYSQTAEQVVEATWRAVRQGRSLLVCGGPNRLLAFLSRHLPLAWQAPLAGYALRRFRSPA